MKLLAWLMSKKLSIMFRPGVLPKCRGRVNSITMISNYTG